VNPAASLLPFVPEFDRGVDEVLSIRACPARVAVVSQQVILLIRANKLTAVLRLVKPLQNFQKDVLVVTYKLIIRNVVEQAFDVVGRGGAFRNQLWSAKTPFNSFSAPCNIVTSGSPGNATQFPALEGC